MVFSSKIVILRYCLFGVIKACAADSESNSHFIVCDVYLLALLAILSKTQGQVLLSLFAAIIEVKKKK